MCIRDSAQGEVTALTVTEDQGSKDLSWPASGTRGTEQGHLKEAFVRLDDFILRSRLGTRLPFVLLDDWEHSHQEPRDRLRAAESPLHIRNDHVRRIGGSDHHRRPPFEK